MLMLTAAIENVNDDDVDAGAGAASMGHVFNSAVWDSCSRVAERIRRAREDDSCGGN